LNFKTTVMSTYLKK